MEDNNFDWLNYTSFVPSTVPSNGPPAYSAITTDRLAMYRCLPRDELSFEWTAFLPPIVITLQIVWIIHLVKGNTSGEDEEQTDIEESRQSMTAKQQINRKLIMSYVLTLLHIVITLVEVALNQSRHTINAVWAIPFSWLCIAISIAVFVKLFWIDRHFFIGLFSSYIPVSIGSALFGWGLECQEDEIHEDNCYMLYNDEVIWVTALWVTLVSLVTLGAYTLVAAILCKWFCSYRTVYETPWVRYIERVEIGWKGYIKFFYLMLIWVLIAVFLGTLSFTSDNGPEGSRTCLSPYGFGAIVIAGASGFLSVIVSMHATYAKLLFHSTGDPNHTEQTPSFPEPDVQTPM